jgi:hypothetical protein
LFLLGHSVWGYLFCRVTGRPLGVSISLPLAFLLGILPDFDLYLQPVGLQHHTYTHSLVVLGPLTVGLLLYRRRWGAAVAAGLLSHLVTDALVGRIPLFYPLSPLRVGVGAGLPSAVDALLEIGGLGVALLYLYRSGDRQVLLHPDARNLRLLVPLVAMVSLSLLFAIDNDIHLLTFAFSRRALSAITVGHFVLGVVFSLGVLRGFAAPRRRPGTAPLPSHNPGGQDMTAAPHARGPRVTSMGPLLVSWPVRRPSQRRARRCRESEGAPDSELVAGARPRGRLLQLGLGPPLTE